MFGSAQSSVRDGSRLGFNGKANAAATEDPTMNRPPFFVPWRIAVAGLSLMSLLAPAQAGTVSGPSAPPSALALHQQQRAACAKPPLSADRGACEQRADATLARALQDQTERRENPGALAANALQRCQAHGAGADREACERMARGEGSVAGSVEGGGTMKELTTRTVGPVPDAAASAAAPAASAWTPSTAPATR